MRVINISIKNWKSIKDETLKDFKKINVFIGPNLAGKTNVANAMRLVLGKGFDFGSHRGKIEKFDFNDRNNSILIKALVRSSEAELTPEYRIDQIGEDVKISTNNDYQKVKGSFFPVGTKRIFYEIGEQKAFDNDSRTNLELAQSKWNEIREEFYNFSGKEISENSPKVVRFFSDVDVISENPPVPIIELGSGYVQCLYFIFEIIKQPEKCKIFLFEEPENHMHVDLQRKFLKYLVGLSECKKMQFFITTHSAVFIDASILEEKYSQVYHVVKKDNSSTVNTLTSSNNQSKWKLLTEDLGYKASDLLISNTVIWVEGPTDVIYLKKWISKYLEENKLNKIEIGIDYTFMFYGGDLLSNLAYENDLTNNKEIIDFTELCLINRNVALITDSDIIKDSKVNFDNDLAKPKKIIIDRFNNSEVFLWITDCTEIENYLNEATFKDVNTKVHKIENQNYEFGQYVKVTDLKKYLPESEKKFKKKDFAKEAIKKDIDFNNWGLGEKIKDLVEWIKSNS